jgi:ankyrin repeat protein
LSIEKEVSPISKLLITNGANPNLPDLDGLTPMHLCILKNNMSIFMALLELNADLELRNNQGQTALFLSFFGEVFGEICENLRGEFLGNVYK